MSRNIMFGYMNTRVTQITPDKCDVCSGRYKRTNEMFGESLNKDVKHVYKCNKCGDYIRYKK